MTKRSKYYKDNPETKRRKNAERVLVDGEVVYKSNPLHPLYQEPDAPEGIRADRDWLRVRAEQITRYHKADAEESSKTDGFVYVIEHVNHEMCKIGFSRNPLSRLKDANTWCPYKGYSLVGWAYFHEDGMSAEAKAHAYFEDQRVDTSEWFRVGTGRALDYIWALREEHDNDHNHRRHRDGRAECDEGVADQLDLFQSPHAEF